ncbi:MAG: SirB1 family protein [Gemmataceae bacterium]
MNLDQTLRCLADDPSAPFDLAEVALHLACDEYAHLDVDAYLSQIEAMAHEAKGYMRGDVSAKLDGLCRYLFHDLGFRGNEADYYDPRNSYLNIVLERRTGIPITLCAVAIAVGQRAGFPVHGLGMPGHFIAKVVVDGQELLFDPFHGGRALTRTDCENLVHQITGVGLEITDMHLTEAPIGFILQRMLTNLKGSYLAREDFRRGIRVIQRMQLLDPLNPLHIRDLGACFLKNQEPGKAIDHLEAYLHLMPKAADKGRVQDLLLEAQKMIAQWN